MNDGGAVAHTAKHVTRQPNHQASHQQSPTAWAGAERDDVALHSVAADRQVRGSPYWSAYWSLHESAAQPCMLQQLCSAGSVLWTLLQRRFDEACRSWAEYGGEGGLCAQDGFLLILIRAVFRLEGRAAAEQVVGCGADAPHVQLRSRLAASGSRRCCHV